MQVTPKSRLQVRLQNILFVVLFLAVIGLLTWLSQHYTYESDWTTSGRHTLSEATVKILDRMEGPVEILAFARSSNLVGTRRNVADMLNRYRQHKDNIHVRYIDPDTEPDKTREFNISVDGELVITYNDRTEHVRNLNEESLTNTLQQLLRSGERHIAFISGHGERKPNGNANYDYGRFSDILNKKGFKLSTISLDEELEIPENIAVLVIAGPQIDYFPGEVAIIQNYIERGGNFFWLHDPGEMYGLQPIADQLDLIFLEGSIIDPYSPQQHGINDATFLVVDNNSLGNHPIVRNFNFKTLFPRAAGIKLSDSSIYEATPFLQTTRHTWTETGVLNEFMNYDPDVDTLGPLNLGVALTRRTQDKKNHQRIVILGDGDFLSNAYLGNGGNQNLGYNIINWLSHDDAFIDIPARAAPDTELVLNSTTWSILGLLFLFGLPLLLLGYGLYIWWQRRKP